MRTPQLTLRLGVRRGLRDRTRKTPVVVARPDLVRRVQQFVAVHAGVSVATLLTGLRPLAIVRARHLAFYICRTELEMTYVAIGCAFRRDHSNIVQAVKRFEPTDVEKELIALARTPPSEQPPSLEYPDALVKRMAELEHDLRALAKRVEEVKTALIHHELRRSYGAVVQRSATPRGGRCQGCGCEVAASETWCGECLCEEDTCD